MNPNVVITVYILRKRLLDCRTLGGFDGNRCEVEDKRKETKFERGKTCLESTDRNKHNNHELREPTNWLQKIIMVAPVVLDAPTPHPQPC